MIRRTRRPQGSARWHNSETPAWTYIYIRPGGCRYIYNIYTYIYNNNYYYIIYILYIFILYGCHIHSMVCITKRYMAATTIVYGHGSHYIIWNGQNMVVIEILMEIAYFDSAYSV